MHKVVYLPTGLTDLSEAIEYLNRIFDAPQAANHLVAALDEVIQNISQFPYSHQLYYTNRPLKNEIRKVPVKNFVLYYAVFEDHIEILRFLHGRRNQGTVQL